jgi:D-alanine-D-alanine ligase
VTASRPRVAVLYNSPTLPTDHPDAVSEADVVAVADAIVAALDVGGFEAWPLAAAPPVAGLVAALSDPRPHLIFNLIEGFGGRSGGEAYVTGLLELLGLPYTGCPPEAQALCHRKGLAKALLRGLGLPTAPFAVLAPGDSLPDWDWSGPAIVKPEEEDASLGIDQGSVVSSSAEMAARVTHLRQEYGPRVLVESYLPGREFNIGVLGLPEPAALPVAEVVFRPPAGSWPILTYNAKWHEGSEEDRASPVRCPAEIDPELSGRLTRLAVAAFLATGCRDVARIDVRLDGRGEPMILEINPNPDLGPSAGWARALKVSGRDYRGTLVALARQALERGTGSGRGPRE